MRDALRAGLDRARALYRRLPMSLRLPAGRLMRGVLEPRLAARLPRAQPGLGKPAEAATLLGLFNAPLGHGAAAHLCALELERAGIAVSRIDVSAAAGAPVEGSIGVDKDRKGALILLMNPDTSIHVLSRGYADLLHGRRVIGYWVWELETPPPHWRHARGLVHEIWTPSTFSAVSLRAAFDVPISIVPHPAALVAHDVATEHERAAGRARIGASEDTFVALTSFSLTSSLARKNPIGAMQAFRDAFSNATNALLVVRMTQADRYPQAAAQIRRAARDMGRSILLLDQLSNFSELQALYAACDVYISLHRSEGFGLNLAEAMLAQRALIATNWSGNTDFMTSECAELIPAKLIDVRDPQQIYAIPGARWVDPDHDAAVAALRKLAADASSRAKLAAAGRTHALSHLQGGSAASALRIATPA